MSRVQGSAATAANGAIASWLSRITWYKRAYRRGREEAYENADKHLDAYFKRMDEAREKGEDFDEPPPRFGSDGN